MQIEDIQAFIDNPEQIANQTVQFQLAVANYSQTPRRLLEVLVNSPDPQVAEAARLHVNWAGELTEGWHSAADEVLQTAGLGQNDRLAVELLKIAPVPEYFLSEWVPADKLIQGLRNPYMPLRYRLKLLERLAQEPTLEPRLQVAESPETPLAVLEQLAGDLELPIRLAVKFNPSCPPQLVELVEGQHAVASDWNTDPEQLTMLGRSRWAWVRLAVAQNPNAPEDLLLRLASDPVLKIQLAVAKNPGTTIAVLEKLADSADSSLQQAVLGHYNISEALMLQLWSKQKSLIMGLRQLPTSILSRIFEEQQFDKPLWQNSQLRYLLLRHANTPAWILACLAEHDLEEIRADRQNCRPHSPEILEKWVVDATDYLAEIAKHPNVSPETLVQLAEHINSKVRLAVARNLKTPDRLRLQLLSELINNPEPRIQVEIASDSNTPVTILQQLAGAFSTVNLVDTIRQMLSEASESLVNAVRNFITSHESPEQISFWLRQDAALREPILREWRQLLANLDKSDRTNFEIFCRQMLPAIGLSGGLPSQDRWLCQYSYPSPEFDLYGLLLLFGLTGNSGNPGRNRAVPVALVGNPTTPTAVRSHLQAGLTQPPDNKGHYLHDCDLRLAVAFNPQTSESERIEYLQQALSSGWNNIREDIAKHPLTPVSILEQIAGRGAGGIQEVAKNPHAPVNILRQAAQQDNSYTLKLVAENPNTPIDLLRDLILNRGKDGVREAALKNSNLDRFAAYQIQLELQEREETVKATQELAKRPNSPYALATVLEGDRNAKLIAARSPKTPIHVLQQLAKDPDETVRQVVLQNPNLPLKSLLELTQDKSVNVRLSLAYKAPRQTTPVQLLERLAQDESEIVRARVAEHPDTPVELLVRLANDPSREVKNKLIGNPNTPVTVLMHLGLTENLVNYRNPNTPGEVLAHAVNRILSDFHQNDIRWSGLESTNKPLIELLKHPPKGSQMPASTLQQLASHHYPPVRYRVASHPNTPTSALEQLAHDSYVPTLRALVDNPNTPPHILEQLANTPDLTTRLSIARNPNTPARVLAQIVLSNQNSGNQPNRTVDALKSAFPGSHNDLLRTIASNPRTPVEALEILARREFVGAPADPQSIIPPTTDDDVVRSLTYNPSLTPQLLSILVQDRCVVKLPCVFRPGKLKPASYRLCSITYKRRCDRTSFTISTNADSRKN